MSIIALTTKTATRYFRADSIGQARLMLAASLGIVASLNAQAEKLPEYIMQAKAARMPDSASNSIGSSYIYDAWAHSQDKQVSIAGLRAMHKSGPDHIKAMYNPDQARITRTMNAARQLLLSMGMNPDD